MGRKILAALIAGLVSCSGGQRSELARLVSPNLKLFAVSMETLSGGTQETLHQDIYVGEQGVPSNLDNPVFSSVGCSGLALAWVNDYTLEIHYPSACAITHFTNRWTRPVDLQVGRANPIEIILVRD